MAKKTSPIANQTGRTPLRRDSQQWVLDYLIQESGKAYHFQDEGRRVPKSVRTHAMISKHTAKEAKRLETFADVELDSGHPETALSFYFKAAIAYADAQHPIFDLNDEKRYLYDRVRHCYDQVRALAPYEIEHIDIPWNGTEVSGLLHLNPNVSGPAPLVFFINGCDNFKESFPNPQQNAVHARGMHAFSFEGPGQAQCNLRGIRMTADNNEQAASAALDYLVERPEIDADQLVLYSPSFASIWGMRFAALDSRFKAVAALKASIAEKYIHMDLESPRWKQLFAFVTQAEDEQELDEMMRAMTMNGYMEKITCPVLMSVGEYDPRAPLHEIYELFDQLTVPAELWVMMDQHHNPKIGDAAAVNGVALDWLRDRLAGKPMKHEGKVVFVDGATGPNSPTAQPKRAWFE